MKSTWSPGVVAKPVTALGHSKAPRHPRGWDKASRAVLNLSELQIVELLRRIHETERQGPDVNPAAVQLTIAQFLRRPPKC